MSAVDYDAPPAYDSPDVRKDTRKYGIFTVHVDFAKSLAGIIKVVATVASIVGFICVFASEFCNSYGPNRFYQFVSQAAFWSTIFLYFIYLMGVDVHVKFINWPLTEFVWSVLDILFFLISSIVLAVNTCDLDSLRAGAVFGFIAMIAFGVNAFLAFRVFRSHAVLSTSSRQQHSTESKY